MYVIIEHEISNPKAFWEIAKTATAALPSHLKVHQIMPNREGTKAVCLWEAPGVDEVRNLVDGAAGNTARNTYFAVEAQNAMGLPTAIKVATN